MPVVLRKNESVDDLGALKDQPAAAKILQGYLRGQPPPFMLFHGPPGVGKWFAAHAFIRHSLCREGISCGHCPSCHKLEHDSHPDLIRFPQKKVAIGDPQDPEPFTVRWLQQTRLAYTPFDGLRRFVLFPRADLILHEAETALLKTLEEPLGHTHFIMLANRLSDARATIASRAVAVPFELLSWETLKELTGCRSKVELSILGGSLHWAPLFRTPFYQHLIGAIPKALAHLQDLLELEQWLLAAEQKSFAAYLGESIAESSFQTEELLNFFALLFLALTEEHSQRRNLAEALFAFKSKLLLGMAGLTPYLIAHLFCRLQGFLYPERSRRG